MYVTFANSLRQVDGDKWNRIFSRTDDITTTFNPFVSYEFLSALEQSGCVGKENGWESNHLLIYQDEAKSELIAAAPLYIKDHSYGEYVFDWNWAQAYQNNGLDYYPKLICAIPYSPVEGIRIGVVEHLASANVMQFAIHAIQNYCQQHHLSGFHCLFIDAIARQQLAETVFLQPQTELNKRLLQRDDIQFHFINQGYSCFDHYLQRLNSAKRKNIRRERKKIQQQGIEIKRLTGAQITRTELSAFFRCYQNTYLKRSMHSGYLNELFFDLLLQKLLHNLMLVVCYQHDEIVASALFLTNEQHLYGRYWGALKQVDCLHFEACFYQGIEHCIQFNLEKFDPGTQGEHKLLRGFTPTKTVSYHWLTNPKFQAGIAHYLTQEQQVLAQYQEQTMSVLPYRKDMQ